VSEEQVTPIERVGLVIAPHRPGAADLACCLCDELRARGRECVVEEGAREACPEGMSFAPLPRCAEADLLVVLGGDGTLLAAAREAAPRGTPLLGVDLGSFGFLAAEEPERLLQDLDQLLAAEFALEHRVMLDVSAAAAESRWALNDIVVAKPHYGRMTRLRASLDGDLIATYPADGLIVATPTGSTAFNLSAGGPIVDGRMTAMILTPICPHTLYSRPLLVPADVTVTLQLAPDGKHQPEASVFVDGQDLCNLSEGDEVVIRRAERDALLVQLGEPRFYDRLREKLRWGTER